MQTLLKLLGILAKVVPLLKPARLDFGGSSPTVRVSGDVAHVTSKARLQRSKVLWFADGGRVEIPLGDVPTPVELHCRNRSQAGEKLQLIQPRIVESVGQLAKSARPSWVDGDVVELELRVRCETGSLLNFPDGEDGRREILDGKTLTTVTIEKNPYFKHVVIDNYEWKKGLDELLPVSEVSIIKNNTVVNDLQVHVTVSTTEGLSVSTLDLDEVGAVLGKEGRPSPPSVWRELSIPLMFKEPNDRYAIRFCSELTSNR